MDNNNESNPPPLTPATIIGAIGKASDRYYQGRWEKYLGLQGLFVAYVSATGSAELRARIKVEYDRRKAPQTKELSTMVAWLGMVNPKHSPKNLKQRVSEVQTLFKVAQKEGIAASGFAAWLVKEGGVSKLVRGKGLNTPDKNKKHKQWFSFARQILNQAKSIRSERSVKPAIEISAGEYAVQVFFKRANGTYESCWAKVSQSDLKFPATKSSLAQTTPVSKAEALKLVSA